MIVEVEGSGFIYAVSPVFEAARWDNNLRWDDPNVRWDGLVPMKNSKNYISLGGTTKTIQQQVLIDKGGTSSISTIAIQIIDKDGEVSKDFSFDNITELLGRKTNVYLNFAQGSHPTDSLPLFRGYIIDYANEAVHII